METEPIRSSSDNRKDPNSSIQTTTDTNNNTNNNTNKSSNSISNPNPNQLSTSYQPPSSSSSSSSSSSPTEAVDVNLNSNLNLSPDTVRLAIKCPSLYQDPETVNVTKQTTVGQIKTLVHSTWPGKPSQDGMRCISAGRLLTDDDVVGDIAATNDSSIPTASLHLVIRPDAWTSPPQLSASIIRTPSTSRQNSLPGTPRDVLAGSSYFGAPTSNHLTTPSVSSGVGMSQTFTTSPLASPAVGITSNPTILPQQSPATPPSFSFGSSPSNFLSGLPNSSSESQEHLSPEKRLSKVIEKLPAQQYELVKEMLLVGHGCYLERYTKLWKNLYPNVVDEQDSNQTSQSSQSQKEVEGVGAGGEADSEKQMSLRVLERDILDWPELPVSIPSIDEIDEEKVISYVYDQITLDGLPYLVRIESTPSLQENSSLLHELHSRLCILQRLCLKMDKLIGYARMGYVLNSGGAISLASSATLTTQQRQAYVSLDPQARAQAIQGLQSLQARLAAATGQQIPTSTTNPITTANAAAAARLSTAQRESARRRNRRIFPHPSDLANIFAPVLFLIFKVSILLYVIARNASPFKYWFLLSTAALYTLYQSSLMLKRQRRLRHAAERARRLAANGGDAGDRLARRMAQRRAQGANAAHRPAGAANPNAAAPAPARQGGQATGTGASASTSNDDPFAPAPPLYAPVRHRATSASTLQWWFEQVAYAGLAREDMQLGLLPPRPTPPNNTNANTGGSNQERSILQIIFPFAFQDQNQTRHHPPSSLGPLDFLPTFLLALLLFIGTLIPEIEMMRRKAIEERENVIRIAARKEEERKEKREEIERLRNEENEKNLEEINRKTDEGLINEVEKSSSSSTKDSESKDLNEIEDVDQEIEKKSIPNNASSSSNRVENQIASASSNSNPDSQPQPLPETPNPPQILASEYSERVLRGQNLPGGIRPGAELDLEAEHEAARRVEAGEVDGGEVATDDTDGAEDVEAEDAEEDMGFF